MGTPRRARDAGPCRRGARDDKFRALAERTADAIGRNARLALVAGAGHAVFLERPGAFVEIVREFLDPNACPSVSEADQRAIPRANRAPNAS